MTKIVPILSNVNDISYISKILCVSDPHGLYEHRIKSSGSVGIVHSLVLSSISVQPPKENISVTYVASTPVYVLFTSNDTGKLVYTPEFNKMYEDCIVENFGFCMYSYESFKVYQDLDHIDINIPLGYTGKILHFSNMIDVVEVPDKHMFSYDAYSIYVTEVFYQPKTVTVTFINKFTLTITIYPMDNMLTNYFKPIEV